MKSKIGLYEAKDKDEINNLEIAEAEFDAITWAAAMQIKAWRRIFRSLGADDTAAREIQERVLIDRIRKVEVM